MPHMCLRGWSPNGEKRGVLHPPAIAVRTAWAVLGGGRRAGSGGQVGLQGRGQSGGRKRQSGGGALGQSRGAAPPGGEENSVPRACPFPRTDPVTCQPLARPLSSCQRGREPSATSGPHWHRCPGTSQPHCQACYFLESPLPRAPPSSTLAHSKAQRAGETQRFIVHGADGQEPGRGRGRPSPAGLGPGTSSHGSPGTS